MIGILGGTFDPVHAGHLRIALELLQELPLEEVRFIPCHRPPHRSGPAASPRHRVNMLRLAIADQPGFVVDERELDRAGPSYMVDTLDSLRQAFGDKALCLILGMDAFVSLDTWHRWQQLIDLSHIVLACRPGADDKPAVAVAALLDTCRASGPQALQQCAAGKILMWPVTQLAISATRIRALIKDNKSPRYLMPEDVWAYIRKESLYL